MIFFFRKKRTKAVYILYMWKFLFPTYCLYCGKESENLICKTCMSELQKYKILNFTENRCKVCFHKLNPIHNECAFCRSRFLFFEKVYALYEYNSFTKKILIEWKYQNQRNLFYIFLEDLVNIILQEQPDRIAFIDSGKSSKKYRNYNHLEDLVKAIYNKVKIPYGGDIKKVKNIKQSKNKQIQRFFEVLNSFELTKKNVHIKKYIIIEDTITTGATINEVSRILKLNHIENIVIVSIFLEDIKEDSLWISYQKVNKKISSF